MDLCQDFKLSHVGNGNLLASTVFQLEGTTTMLTIPIPTKCLSMSLAISKLSSPWCCKSPSKKLRCAMSSCRVSPAFGLRPMGCRESHLKVSVTQTGQPPNKPPGSVRVSWSFLVDPYEFSLFPLLSHWVKKKHIPKARQMEESLGPGDMWRMKNSREAFFYLKDKCCPAHPSYCKHPRDPTHFYTLENHETICVQWISMVNQEM